MAISRRSFLKIAGLSMVATLSQFGGFDNTFPNVLLILVDSLNDWVGALGGHPNAFTPNIDRLAQRGMLFTNAHCVGTNSNASRTSLFTGLHPMTSGIYGGDTLYRELYPLLITLPQFYLRARYGVMGSGRLFHEMDRYSWMQTEFFPFENRFVDEGLNGINFGPNFDWGALDIDESQMHDALVTQWGIDKINTLENPFFLSIGLSSTRHPWYLPEAQYNRFSPQSVTLPDDSTAVLPPEAQALIESNGRHRAVLQADQWAESVAAYLACMAYVDDNVGKILNNLDESPHADNTIIIFTSTHGLHLGDKGMWLFDTLWEQLTRVPLILAFPDGTAEANTAGQSCEQAVSLLDIYPTLVDFWGREPLPHLDGRSLLPLIRNLETQWEHPVLIAKSENEIAVRTNDWRYIRYSQGGEELYEYIGDQQELINLATNPARRQTKQRLASLLPELPEGDS